MKQNQRTILIVDDSPEDREIYHRYLLKDEQYTYKIWQAETGEEGLQLCQQGLPDAILLDFMLLDMTGLEFLSEMKTQLGRNDLPVLMLTGQGNEAIAVAAMKSGASDYLIKGKTNAESLRLAVHKVIEQTCFKRQLERSQQRFLTSIENMVDCFGICTSLRDDEGTIVDFLIEYVNAAACAHNGMTAQEQIGQRLLELLPYDWASVLFNQCCFVVETGEPLVRELLIYADPIHQQDLVRAFDIHIAKLEDGFVASWCDNTKRKQAELALQESEERLRLAIEGAELGMWNHDLVSGRLSWTQRCSRMLGLAPNADTSYEIFLNAVHPDDRQWLTQGITQSVINEAVKNFDYQYRTLAPDGTVRWIASRGRTFCDEAGKPVRAAGVTLDISLSKRREEQLRLLESVIVNTNDAVVITAAEPIDPPGPRIVYVNPAFTEMTGYTLEEAIGQTPRILQGSSTARAALARIRSALQSWQPVRVDLVNYRKDGSEFWVELSLVPVANETGWFTHWIAVQRDISDRKHAEAALQQANEELEMRVAERTAELIQVNRLLQQELAERQKTQEALLKSETEFRVLSEASPVGIFRVDAQGNCTYTNPRAQAICGYTFDEALGDGWQRFVHPEDIERYLCQWCKATAALQEFSDEVRCVRRDGTIRFGRVKTAPIFSALGNAIGYVGTIEDITEMRTVEKMKREFISIVSHELRTPLASIRGALGLVSSGLLNDEPDTAQEMLEIATLDTERLVRLVNDILDLDRLESHKITLIQRWCDAATLMRQAVESLQPLAEENNITLSLAPLSVQIYVDPDRIIQTLVNLLSNAIKFSSPSGKVWLSAELGNGEWGVGSGVETSYFASFQEWGVGNGEWGVLFKVKDQGRGIPADKLETIFERFQQVDASDSRQKGGTGLGLAICRSIVQLHGGEIWVESVLGAGSTFYFTVPRSLE